MVKRTGELVEESDLLAVLEEARGCGGLICGGGGGGGEKTKRLVMKVSKTSLTCQKSRAVTSNDDAVVPRRAELQGHLMLVFVDSQVILIGKSLWKAKKKDNGQVG